MDLNNAVYYGEIRKIHLLTLEGTSLFQNKRKLVYGSLALVILIIGAIVFLGRQELSNGAFNNDDSAALPEVQAPVETATQVPEKTEEELAKEKQANETSSFDKYLGDWYGKLPYGEPMSDGREFFVAIHIHVDKVTKGNDTMYMDYTIYFSPYLSTDKDFNHNYYTNEMRWDSESKHFFYSLDEFSLSETDSDTATLITDSYRNPTEERYKFTMKRMPIEDIQKEKDDLQQFVDSLDSGSSTDTIPQYIIGSWSGVVPYEGDYMGFRFNFKSIDGTNAEGTLTQVENKGDDPNYTYGVDYRFTATLDAESNSLIIKWSDGNFMFRMAGEGSATYQSQYGDVPLSKK
jgi:hypothetical protein